MTEEHQEKIWAHEAKLVEVSNLVAALEVVSWQLCQVSLQGEPAYLRDAVIGISRALAREIKEQD